MSNDDQPEQNWASIRLIKQLSTRKNRPTDLVQDIFNGRILVISSFPKIQTPEAKNINSNDYYKKYALISHPCLANPHGEYIFDFSDQNSVRYVAPYYLKGSLANIISLEAHGKHPFEWTPTQKSICAFGILIGLKALHIKKIIHGFLTPNNIFLSRNLEPKISEYWLSELYDKNATDMEDSKTFIQDNPSQENDIYSYGAIFYCIAKKVTNCASPIMTNGIKPEISALITKCLEKTISIDEILRGFVDGSLLFEGTDKQAFVAYAKRLNGAKIAVLNFVPKPIPTFIDVKEITELVHKYAEAGDSRAHFLFGCFRREGVGISVNKNAALKSFKVAADSGIPEAQYIVHIIMGAKPKNQNIRQEANNYLVDAADNGFVEAQYRLANFLLRGDNFPKNSELAEKYFTLAADQGHLESQLKLVELYSDKTLEDKDNSKLLKFSRLSALQGNKDSLYKYATLLISQNNPQNKPLISDYLLRSARQGNANAETYLAQLIISKNASLGSEEEELELIKRASDSGDEVCRKYFCNKVANGEVPNISSEERLKYIKIGSEIGDETSLLRYAFYLVNGTNVQTDIRKAIDCYIKSYNMYNNPMSAYLAADLILKNNIVKNQTADLLKAASDAGIPDAMYLYASKYLKGPSKDELLQKSSNAGSEQAQYALGSRWFKRIDKKVEGANLMFEAANNGCIEAVSKIARLGLAGKLEDTIDQKFDDPIANYIEFLIQAADDGDFNAMQKYGEMLLDGDEVEYDPKKAMYYFEIASKGGISKADYELYVIYSKGLGVEPDQEKARKYLKNANDANRYMPYKETYDNTDIGKPRDWHNEEEEDFMEEEDYRYAMTSDVDDIDQSELEVVVD